VVTTIHQRRFMTSEYPNQYVECKLAVISGFQSSYFPETQIIPPPTPPFQSHTSPNSDFRSVENAHCHTCDCGSAFVCEMGCGPEEEQQCEYCEVWNLSHNRGSNKQRLADYLDDQAVIEELRAQEKVSRTSTGKGDNE